LKVYAREPLNSHGDEAVISLHLLLYRLLEKHTLYLCIKSFCPRFVFAFVGIIYGFFLFIV